ncbi:hypothetical protein, partial [Enterobacter hormaechei]
FIFFLFKLILLLQAAIINLAFFDIVLRNQTLPAPKLLVTVAVGGGFFLVGQILKRLPPRFRKGG